MSNEFIKVHFVKNALFVLTTSEFDATDLATLFY